MIWSHKNPMSHLALKILLLQTLTFQFLILSITIVEASPFMQYNNLPAPAQQRQLAQTPMKEGNGKRIWKVTDWFPPFEFYFGKNRPRYYWPHPESYPPNTYKGYGQGGGYKPYGGGYAYGGGGGGGGGGEKDKPKDDKKEEKKDDKKDDKKEDDKKKDDGSKESTPNVYQSFYYYNNENNYYSKGRNNCGGCYYRRCECDNDGDDYGDSEYDYY